MSRPRLLDLFGGQGGAGKGYILAEFEAYAVDRTDHSARYPGAFHVGDALDVLCRLVAGERIAFTHRDGTIEWLGLSDFAAIHASPPCQGYTIATAGNPQARAKHLRLIAATRELLELTGLPWVIENVEQARRQMVDPIMLCGRMFGLAAEDEDGLPLVLDRHRLFESNIQLEAPAHPRHGSEQVAGVYGGSRRAKRRPGETLAEVAPRDRYAARYERGGVYVPRSIHVQQALLGIDWMTVRGMQESIPPAYAEWVGRQLLAHVTQEAVA
jgi:DNA (cytosine-5)-methyltransferase 1